MQAVILKKIPVKEYDELIVCYTPDLGKITCVAKSVQRPTSKQAGHLDILNLVDFEPIQKNQLPIITNAYSLNNYGNIKNSLPALAIGNYLLEIFDKFVFESDPDVKLWNFLGNTLERLDSLAGTVGVNWKTEFAGTQNSLLEVLGYNHTTNLEDIIQSRLNSLIFSREVL